MPDKLYTFGCTFNVVKRDWCPLSDMQLAKHVLEYLQENLTVSYSGNYVFVKESIHPIMVGPEGGVDVE